MPETRNDREKQTRTGREEPSSGLVGRERGRSEIRRRPAFDFGTSPFEAMRRLTEQMFSPLGPSVRGLSQWGEQIWAPEIEVFERDGKLVVRADLPGLKKEDIKVEVRNDTLIIQGERREERKEDREGYFLSERSYGSFYRAVPLPEGVNAENAKATFRDGVLELTMDAPKGRQTGGRTIPIEESRETR